MVESLRTNLETIIPHITVGRISSTAQCACVKGTLIIFQTQILVNTLSKSNFGSPIRSSPIAMILCSAPVSGAPKPSGSLIEVKGRIRGLLQLDSGRMLALSLLNCDNSTRFVMFWRRETRH